MREKDRNALRVEAWHRKGGPAKHLEADRLGEGYAFPIDWQTTYPGNALECADSGHTWRSLAWLLVALLTAPWPSWRLYARLRAEYHKRAPF